MLNENTETSKTNSTNIHSKIDGKEDLYLIVFSDNNVLSCVSKLFILLFGVLQSRKYSFIKRIRVFPQPYKLDNTFSLGATAERLKINKSLLKKRTYVT